MFVKKKYAAISQKNPQIRFSVVDVVLTLPMNLKQNCCNITPIKYPLFEKAYSHDNTNIGVTFVPKHKRFTFSFVLVASKNNFFTKKKEYKTIGKQQNLTNQTKKHGQ